MAGALIQGSCCANVHTGLSERQPLHLASQSSVTREYRRFGALSEDLLLQLFNVSLPEVHDTRGRAMILGGLRRLLLIVDLLGCIGR